MRELTRHIIGSNDYWLSQGPFCKTVTLSSSSGLGAQEQQEGATAALVAMGAGAPGIEGLSSGTKRIEKTRTNSMGASPRAEDDGGGRNSGSTVAGSVRAPGAAALVAAGRRRRLCRRGAGAA
jgi:hypothetical protein